MSTVYMAPSRHLLRETLHEVRFFLAKFGRSHCAINRELNVGSITVAAGLVLRRKILVSSHQNTSESIIVSVASHEQALLEQLEQSKEDAQSTLEKARTAARTHLQEAEATLNDEMASLRRTKATAREAEFQGTVSAAEASLESVRSDAAAKVDAVAQDVLDLFLPKTKGGN